MRKTLVNFPDIAVTIVCYCVAKLQQVHQDKPQQKDHLVKPATVLKVEALMMAHALQTTYLFIYLIVSIIHISIKMLSAKEI